MCQTKTFSHLDFIRCLDQSGCQYAFYFHPKNRPPEFFSNHECFISASIIKLPILLAWVTLERTGELDRQEICSLDGEPEVKGAGLARFLTARSLPYQDVLLFMMALSDNLCTNLVIRRIGFDRLNDIINNQLALAGTRLERRLMDFAARAQGKDNWVSAGDCIRLFDLFHGLSEPELQWVELMLANNQDSGLLLRDIRRDELTFHHKTGSIPGVLHDWGYTDQTDLFLLTNQVKDELEVTRLFGEAGQLLLR